MQTHLKTGNCAIAKSVETRQVLAGTTASC